MAAEPMEWSDAENNQLGGVTIPKHRGIVIIAIFHSFDPKLCLKDISHTEKDKELLEKGFSKLKYGVVVWDDVMGKKVFFQRLNQVSRHPLLKNCETFAFVAITHGFRNGILCAYDGYFRREDVYNYFKDENCSGLKDKLKLFIFHACRGNKLGKGVQADGSVKHPSRSEKIGEKIEKDMLILCSTFEENVAFAPLKDKGSFFISALSRVLEEEGCKDESSRKHILAVLTDVIRITASKNFGTINDIKKQQPSMILSLKNLYYFKDKEEIPDKILEDLAMANLLPAV